MERQDGAVILRGEDDAWDLLEAIVSGAEPVGDLRSVRFEGWPRLHVYVPEGRLDSALTPYMMQGFVDLQRSVYRTHALLVHGEANGRLLSDLEKESLELKVRVTGGSSDAVVDLQGIIDSLGALLVNKMESHHIAIVLATFAVLFAGTTAYRLYLQSRKEERLAGSQNEALIKALETVQFIAKTDVERSQVLMKVMDQVPEVAGVWQESEDAAHSIVRHNSENEVSTINGVTISGDIADKLTRGSRAESVEVRLDGTYRILKVDTTSEDGFRVQLEDVDTGATFYAGVQDALLSEQQKRVLQDAEWNKKPVVAHINARRRRNEILDATVIDVGEANRSGAREGAVGRQHDQQ